jgi:ribosomal protein S18 acetylase RimI-like enzyme
VGVRHRRATDNDSPFCFALHEAAMGPVIAEVFGSWVPHVQRRFHEQWFDPNRLQILEVDAIPVGVLDVLDLGDHLYLARLEVLPEWQGRRIGSSVIADMSTSAAVRLHLFVANVRARSLYERLGFTAVDTDEGRIEMLRPASSRSPEPEEL